ncbi:Di-copper centre-containing protein, partial [Lojkania enalia]
RLEIRELEKNKDQWNIYLLGMRKFQSMDQKNKLSWYQIAGIHGRPHVAWDGVESADGGGGGYCAHGANIFPTWHRPYLALFEEILYLNARQAVSEFPNGALKDRYSAALATFRMPYWDWAAIPPEGEGVYPWSVQREKVDVVTPNGTETIANPLFEYTFHPLVPSDMGGHEWSVFPTTLRNPSSKQENASSQNDLVSHQLDSMRPNIQSRVYNVLALQKDYHNVSNDMVSGDSLESTHDTIHNYCGVGGHLSKLDVAAFDPLFWLHHANVDRLLAIWQALNPSSYVTPFKSPWATFTIPRDVITDINTELKPFHRNDDGAFWTSESIRQTSIFAYTYPELLNHSIESLITKVNALYGPDATPQWSRNSLSAPSNLAQRATLSPNRISGTPNFSGERQYMASIRVCKFGLDGSFNVYVFLGDSGEDVTCWTSEEAFVGVTGILATGMKDEQGSGDVTGAVPLTAALEARVRSGELKGLGEEEVTPFLRDNLKWRVSKTDGKAVDVESTPGFRLSVLVARVQPARSANEFPKMLSDYEVLAEATEGKPGGFRPGDPL